MADLEPGIKLSASTIEAMDRISTAPPTVDLSSNKQKVTSTNESLIDLDSVELRLFEHDSIEIRLIGSRTLTTKSGREIQESRAFEAYWVPAKIAQSIIKANGFANQAKLLVDCLRQAPEEGYWIASADEEDETFLLRSCAEQIKDQRVSKVVRRGEDGYEDLKESTRYYIQQPDPYSYLFVADLPEADIFWRLVDSLMDEEYLPCLQVHAMLAQSTTPETSIG